MDVLFLIPHIPNPRIIKRILTAKEIGATSVVYWNRGILNQERNPLPTDVSEYEILVKSNEGKPLKRLLSTFIFALKAIRKLNQIKPKLIYSSKLDMLLLAVLYRKIRVRKPSIVYEASDMHELVFQESASPLKKTIRSIFVSLEKVALRSVDLLIVTSPGFLDQYYSDFFSRDNSLFLPNVPRHELFLNYKHKADGLFTIGWIGKVRYKRQMQLMIDAAGYSNSNVMIAGSGVDYEFIKDYIKDKVYVEFYGPYQYEKEIAQLYSKVDCICSVYDSNIHNVRVALPNRLYEAVICGVPIIASKNTALGSMVEQLGVGITVDAFSMKEMIEAINKLKEDRQFYESIVDCCNRLKYEFDNNRYEKPLFDRLCKLMVKK